MRAGDSIYSIAKEYSTTPARIIADNGITDPGKLAVGQTLVILYPTETYTVRGGDTLEGIARSFGVTLNELWQNNPALGGKTLIYPGQTLNIRFDTPPLGEIAVNGYAYPFIDPDTLRRTLPYLTYLSVFTYGIRPDGTLVPPSGGNESELITLAREYGTVPLMMLTSLTDKGTFSSELAGKIISDESLSRAISNAAVQTMQNRGYGGIDVDFEYIEPNLADDYVRFLEIIRAALPSGYELFVSLAPKTSDTQPGLLYEGHDYAALGAVADKSLVMTYEWGYTYGPPMAVAPIGEVRRVLEYAVSRIPQAKVLMGIPNYGYNWTLPYVRGESRAKSLSNVAAVNLAIAKNAEIQHDERAATPFFTYFEREGSRAVEHEVWFDDARSMDAKLRLMNEYALAGGSVWNIMNYFPALWAVMNSLYSIRKA